MRKIILFGLAALFFATSCKHESLRERLYRESIEFNKKCPQRLDQATTLDSVNYSIEQNEYTYHYSLESEIASQINNENSNDFRSNLLESLKNATNLMEQKNEGVTFTYIYYDKESHNVVFKTSLNAQDYK